MNELPPLTMRPLSPDDRAAVTELVQGVDPDDWLLQELDLLLAGPGPDGIRGYGGYGVELPGGRLAGVCLLDFTRPGEVYLGGLRISAHWQNRGLGTRFLWALAVEAAHWGARGAWLTSALDNLPMHRVATKAGFARVGEWQVWMGAELAAVPPGGPAVRQAGPADAAAVAGCLRRYPPVGEEGLSAPDYTVWDVMPVEQADFTAWLTAGELAVAESDGPGAPAGLMASHWGTADPLRRGVPRQRGGAPGWVATPLVLVAGAGA